LNACSSVSEAAGGGALCAIRDLGVDGGAGVLGAVVGDVLVVSDDSKRGVGDDVLTKGGGGGDRLSSIDDSAILLATVGDGDSSTARRVPTSTCTVAAHCSRIVIGPGRRRKPWGGSGSLARALEELTVTGGIVKGVRISGNINGKDGTVQVLAAKVGDPNRGDVDMLVGGRDDLTAYDILRAGSNNGLIVIGIGGDGLGNGGGTLVAGDDDDVGNDCVLSAMWHAGVGIVAEVRDILPDGVRLLEDNTVTSLVADDDGSRYRA
jgi:hypothetical protein